MEYRMLGRTGLKVSIAGLGTGGASQLGQRTGKSAEEAHRLVRTALDLGINIFDSSPSYGQSEEWLGKGLRGVPRDKYVLATKFQPHEGKALKANPQALMEQLEQSLRLLGVDAIDVLQYHGVTPEEYRAVVERFHPVALRAKEAGKVRFVGITETVIGDTTHEMLAAALQEDLMDTFMIKYGILNQSARPRIWELAQQHNVGVFVMAPVRTSLRNPAEAVTTLNQFIDQGLLAIPRPRLEDPLGLAAAGGEIPSLTRAAYQFAAAPQAVSTVLIGTGSVEHLRANVADFLAPTMSAAQFAYLTQTYGALAWGA